MQIEVIDGVEYTVEAIEILGANGKVSHIVNRHPVLDPEEKERRHQESLKVIDRILQKYNFG